ncbi:MAG: TetR/AcrR family transcriptional regulator [Bacteroidetes bacterium]|nr:TetR/AcrR family transcriptional regulator [Bacteroidota bacterium]
MKITISIDEKVFIKDPNSSEVGRKIIQYSILHIEEIGFESFTFKKLADKIGASEPTIYRYFENKHKLLLYLLSWYWNWMEYKLMIATTNVSSPDERLRISLKLLSEPIEKDPNFEHVDEAALYKIVISESSKVYLNKEVDKVNKEGLFLSYKRLCHGVAKIITEINPNYRFPRALVSTVVESSHDQRFFAEHLPALTEIKMEKLNSTSDFLSEMVFNTIKRID